VGDAVGVSVGLVVAVGVAVCVAVWVGVQVLVAVGLGVNVEVAEGVQVGVAVAVGLGVRVGVAVGVGLAVAVGVFVVVAVAVGLGVRVGVVVAVGVLVAVADGVDVGRGARSCQTVTRPAPFNTIRQFPRMGRSMRQTSSWLRPGTPVMFTPWVSASNVAPLGAITDTAVWVSSFQITSVMLARGCSTAAVITRGWLTGNSAASARVVLASAPVSPRTMAW